MTEANLLNLTGKVFFVTGDASEVRLELCALLYQVGGKVPFRLLENNCSGFNRDHQSLFNDFL